MLNLRGTYRVSDSVSIFARIENALDTDYETFGLLGEPEEVFPDFEDPRFLGAGPRFGAWLGVKVARYNGGVQALDDPAAPARGLEEFAHVAGERRVGMPGQHVRDDLLPRPRSVAQLQYFGGACVELHDAGRVHEHAQLAGRFHLHVTARREPNFVPAGRCCYFLHVLAVSHGNAVWHSEAAARSVASSGSQCAPP